MKGPEQWRVVIVGSGNVAWHLGHVLVEKGVRISQVLGRTAIPVQQLAKELHAGDTGIPEDMDPGADFCLICISDDAIPSVVKRIKPGNCLLLHTAGSVPMDIFKDSSRNYGVLYPLQTFTKGRPLVYSQIPFLIEANTAGNRNKVRHLAELISRNVIQADSVQRLNMHMTAVFASNFSNHMIALAEKLSREYGFPFDLLLPLIEETAAKAMSISPHEAQTGPAARGNHKIMAKHLALLQRHPDLQNIYKMISASIQKETMKNEE